MLEALESWFGNVPPSVMGWVSTLSVLTFLASLVIVPWIVVRIPADYFSKPRRQEPKLRRMHPALYLVVRVAKNVLAVVLLIGGILMLVLPGQGLLTILIGIMLSDFPGKYRLQRRLLGTAGILNGINWIRRKADVEPLQEPAAG